MPGSLEGQSDTVFPFSLTLTLLITTDSIQAHSPWEHLNPKSNPQACPLMQHPIPPHSFVLSRQHYPLPIKIPLPLQYLPNLQHHHRCRCRNANDRQRSTPRSSGCGSHFPQESWPRTEKRVHFPNTSMNTTQSLNYSINTAITQCENVHQTQFKNLPRHSPSQDRWICGTQLESRLIRHLYHVPYSSTVDKFFQHKPRGTRKRKLSRRTGPIKAFYDSASTCKHDLPAQPP